MMDELKKRTGILYGTLLVLAVAVLVGATATAAESGATQQQVDELKRTVGDLAAEVNRLKAAESGTGQTKELDPAMSKLRLGGYGEMHANFSQGSGQDQFDFHRVVLYVGYDFAEWIKFNSEFEFEHALVTDGADGEISIEQAYFDFLFTGKFNVRVGRILTPIGIINKKHEPTTFNGVERPSFATFIIPTTWPSDGAGVFGSLTENVTYEAYVVGSLDGSGFNDIGGIRGGRIKERPSLSEPAITGRVDYHVDKITQKYPDHTMRVGASGYYGGLRNGNQGINPPLSGEVRILSADCEYSVNKWDFRGVVAHINISGANQINNLPPFNRNVADEIFGWYLEAAYHWLPEEWKTGKLAEADSTVFLRYDDYDTQYEMPSGVSKNGDGNRRDVTIGTNFWLTPNLVAKADYQFRDDDSGGNPDNLLNFGLGWVY